GRDEPRQLRYPHQAPRRGPVRSDAGGTRERRRARGHRGLGLPRRARRRRPRPRHPDGPARLAASASASPALSRLRSAVGPPISTAPSPLRPPARLGYPSSPLSTGHVPSWTGTAASPLRSAAVPPLPRLSRYPLLPAPRLEASHTVSVRQRGGSVRPQRSTPRPGRRARGPNRTALLGGTPPPPWRRR